MKTTKFMACLLAFATIAGVTGALADHPVFNLGVGVQYWDAKDLDSFDKDGLYGLNAIARIQPSDYLGIDFRAGCSGVWKGDKYRVNGVKYDTDVTFICVPLEVGLVLMLPLTDSITLYGGPGAGYYYYDIDIETTSKHGHHIHSERTTHIKLEDDFGWYAVAGLNFRLAQNFSLFGEARYTDTDTKLKDGDSEVFDCTGVGVQVGFMFNF